MLVRLPKEVGKVMTRLQEAGFEAYVAGECVRDSILGRKPFGWDVTTNAGLEDLKAVFPEAEVFSEKFGVIRLEYIEEAKVDGEVVEVGEESNQKKVVINPAVNFKRLEEVMILKTVTEYRQGQASVAVISQSRRAEHWR